MSTLNPDNDLPEPADEGRHGDDTGALGPSDSSDTGSDIAGAKRHEFDVDTELDSHALETGKAARESDTDESGTGERASADGDSTLEEDADIQPDHIEQPFAPDEEAPE
ncbi:chemotaxis protein [Paraburkholderia kururiensis]|uniref:Chemotaxis protein n=1 Tax=Paraburkholderia kururiensis TaxID=984307 RepID=A0ABZ0WNN1_9BURK|nr:chemotaxis protein [Paraburkholderia kururiensis]WQD78861.1 chemotaxis protein [Paraburkholderia kururiensis]